MSKIDQNHSKFSAKTREVISIEIEENMICLRGLSPQRLRFEVEYGLERGSTANSFFINGEKKFEDSSYPAILIHPPGAAYKDIFTKALNKLVPQVNQKLLVIIGHVNPNRVALLRELAKIYTNIEFICSGPGAKLLKELWYQQKPIHRKQR